MAREHWIDLLRWFCMMCILWFHTEMYYAGRDVTPYTMYVGDVLACFFFLTGYLLYRRDFINTKKKLKGICRNILVPYFVFTTLIALAKVFLYAPRGNNLRRGSPLLRHPPATYSSMLQLPSSFGLFIDTHPS